MPFVSVVVPVYNAEKSIERCVESVARQRFVDWELLLIDDGSSDKSGSICDTLAAGDGRIQVFHKENGGVSSARNKGMALARGKYLLFLDSDDYWPENYLEPLVSEQKKRGEDVFCWTAIQLISENHSVPETVYSYDKQTYSMAERSDILKFSARYLLNSPVNKLYRTKLIKDHALHMPEQISIAEDLWFNLQYMEAMGNTHVLILNQVIYAYVRNGESSLDSGYRNHYYEIHKKILRELLDCSRRWGAPIEDQPLYDIRYWEYMQNAFYNLDMPGCPLSAWQKFWEKGRILRDSQFQKCLRYQKDNMGKGTYWMMRTRSYLLVWLYGRIRQRSLHGEN